MSGNGEEDGVDNRVEVPTWAPAEDGESAAQGQEADVASAGEADSSSAPSGSEPVLTPPVRDATTQATQPQASNSPTPTQERPAQLAAGGGAAEKNWRSPAGPVAAAPAAPSATGPAPANGSAQPGVPTAQPVVPSAPLASRAPTTPMSGPVPVPSTVPLPSMPQASRAPKARSPFSGLTRPGSKVSPKLSQGQPGKSAGVRPHPQAWAGPSAGPSPAATPSAAGPQTRRAQLRLDRIEPWSVMKFSFMISLVGWVILLVAVSVLYFALSRLGVFSSIEHTIGLVTTSKSKPGSNATNWFKASRVLGYTMLVGAVNVVLITALATIGAVLYNLVTLLAGGIEVTLKESD